MGVIKQHAVRLTRANSAVGCNANGAGNVVGRRRIPAALRQPRSWPIKLSLSAEFSTTGSLLDGKLRQNFALSLSLSLDFLDERQTDMHSFIRSYKPQLASIDDDILVAAVGFSDCISPDIRDDGRPPRQRGSAICFSRRQSS